MMRFLVIFRWFDISFSHVLMMMMMMMVVVRMLLMLPFFGTARVIIIDILFD